MLTNTNLLITLYIYIRSFKYILTKVDLGYLFLDKVDALPSMEKIAKALDKVNITENINLENQESLTLVAVLIVEEILQ